MDAVLDKALTLLDNVEISKFTVLLLDTAVSDSVRKPSGANAGPIAGVAQESVLPNGFNDYSGGQLQITTGTAWPAGAIPSSALNRNLTVRRMGISRCVAASAINPGDEVNLADTAGRVKTATEGGGTLVHIVGQAIDAATAQGDIIRVMVMPRDRHT